MLEWSIGIALGWMILGAALALVEVQYAKARRPVVFTRLQSRRWTFILTNILIGPALWVAAGINVALHR